MCSIFATLMVKTMSKIIKNVFKFKCILSKFKV